LGAWPLLKRAGRQISNQLQIAASARSHQLGEKVRTGRRKLHAGSGFVQFQPIPCDGGPPIERAVRAITGRLFSTIADHGPAHCLNFGEAVKITRTPDRPLIVRVLCPARLTMSLTDKILSTTETED